MTKINWTYEDLDDLYYLSLNDLLYQAQTVHKQNFSSDEVQLSTLLNIKTGACPEDCRYCTQSGHYETGLRKEKLWSLEEVLKKAEIARKWCDPLLHGRGLAKPACIGSGESRGNDS